MNIFTPSYVYVKYREKLKKILDLSASIVASGTSKPVRERFNLQNLDADERTSEFSIFMPSEKLKNYLTKIESLGVNGVIFAYPQDHSLETIQELAEALQSYL